MKRSIVWTGIALVGFVLTDVAGQGLRSGTPLALRFDPVFRLVQLSGDVFVLRPGEEPRVDAETGREFLPPARDLRSYPFGTRMATSTNAGCRVRLSRFSEIEVQSETTLVLDEKKEDTRHKKLHLHTGRIEVKLEEGIEENSNALTVRTAGAYATATNLSEFTVHVRHVDDRTVSDFVAHDGMLRVYHPELFEMYFVAVEKGRAFGVRVTNSPDGNFVDIRGLQGTFGVKVRDPLDPDDVPPDDLFGMDTFGGLDGFEEEMEVFEGLSPEEGFRIIRVTPDYNVKFSKRRDLRTEALMVTILQIDAQGDIKDEITYQEGAPPRPELVADAAAEFADDGFLAPAPAREEAVEEMALDDMFDGF